MVIGPAETPLDAIGEMTTGAVPYGTGEITTAGAVPEEATGETTTTGAVPELWIGEATALEVVVSGWYGYGARVGALVVAIGDTTTGAVPDGTIGETTTGAVPDDAIGETTTGAVPVDATGEITTTGAVPEPATGDTTTLEGWYGYGASEGEDEAVMGPALTPVEIGAVSVSEIVWEMMTVAVELSTGTTIEPDAVTGPAVTPEGDEEVEAVTVTTGYGTRGGELEAVIGLAVLPVELVEGKMVTDAVRVTLFDTVSVMTAVSVVLPTGTITEPEAVTGPAVTPEDDETGAVTVMTGYGTRVGELEAVIGPAVLPVELVEGRMVTDAVRVTLFDTVSVMTAVSVVLPTGTTTDPDAVMGETEKPELGDDAGTLTVTTG